MRQPDLFPEPWPEGLQYRPDFLSADEERALLEIITALPLSEAQYKEYLAKRRTVSYGSSYDFAANRSVPAPALPEFLLPLRRRIAQWCETAEAAFVQALVSEYRPGTQLGWHRDVPEFEIVVGVSLAGSCRLRFRPYPWSVARKKEIFALTLEPRSAYILRGAARWHWQHSVPPTSELRYSITLRTSRAGTAVSAPR